MIAPGYACYALAGWGAGWRVLGYLPGYASEEGLRSSGGILLLRLLAQVGPLPAWASLAYAWLCLLGLPLLALYVARWPLPADPATCVRIICRDSLWLGVATMAALSPYYPWYLTALAVPAVLALRPGALWLTLSAPVLYLDPDHDAALWPSLVFPSLAGLPVLQGLRHPRLPSSHAPEGGL